MKSSQDSSSQERSDGGLELKFRFKSDGGLENE